MTSVPALDVHHHRNNDKDEFGLFGLQFRKPRDLIKAPPGTRTNLKIS